MIAGKAQFRCMTATATMSRVNVVSADLTQILLDLDAINGEVIGTTAAEKTDKIEATKLAIETAIEAANVDVPAGTVFADYAAKIDTIGDNYTRPSFWPELPEIAVDVNGFSTEEVIYLLVAVWPDGINRIGTINIAQDIIVEWGDGVTKNVANGVNFSHIYDFNSITSPVTPRGYKTVTIKIVPKTTGTFFNLPRFNLAPFNFPILHFKISANNYALNNGVRLTYAPLLEIVENIGRPNYMPFPYSLILCPSVRILKIDSRSVLAAPSFLRTQNNVVGRVTINNDNTIDLSGANVSGYLDGFMDGGLYLSPPKLKIITPPSNITTTTAYLLRYHELEDIEVTECGGFTNSPVLNGRNLRKLKLTNIKLSFSVANTLIGFAEAKRIIENDLGVPATTSTLTITGTPDAAAIMAAITAGTIVVPAGWTVIN